MPRYFFHLRDQDQLHEDCEGMDLPDLQSALEEVLRTNRELAAEPAGIYGLEFEIADSKGQTLLTMPVQACRRSRSRPSLRDTAHQHHRTPDKPKLPH